MARKKNISLDLKRRAHTIFNGGEIYKNYFDLSVQWGREFTECTRSALVVLLKMWRCRIFFSLPELFSLILFAVS